MGKRIKDLSQGATEADLVSGNYFALDGSEGTKKLNSTTLLTKTAQNSLAGNVVPAFDETGETTYLAGTPVSRGGKTYIFKVDHSGAWSTSDVLQIPSSEGFLKVCRSKIIETNYIPSSLNDLKESFVYIIERTANLTTTGFPADAPASEIFKLSVTKSYSSSSRYQVGQELKMLKDTSETWYRQYNTITSSWGSWSKSNFALSVEKNQLFSGWTKNPASLDDVAENSVLHLTVSRSTTTTNIPSDFLVGSATDGTLFTFKCFYSGSNYRIYQTLIRESDGMIWARYWQGSWQAWVAKSVDYMPLDENQIFHTAATNPASLNDLTTSQIVRVWRDSSVTTTNFPSDYPTEAKGTLSIYKVYSSKSNNQYQIYQILTLDSSNEKWTRYYNSINNTWNAWVKATPTENTIIIGVGQTYTTLRAGIAEAYSRNNAEVIIMPGEYDCVTEWETELHAVTEETTEFGNPVGNGMHIIAMPGSKIKALVEREDFQDLTDAQFNRLGVVFSVFRARSGSFTVENLDIESKHTRYCFHDDSGTTSPSVRKFLNCRMLRHTDNASAAHNPLVACIGGGLSLKETVVIDGGWYRTEPSYGNLDIMGGDVDYSQVPISYHQNAGDSCEASITIKNVYLDDKGFFRFGYYGTSVEKCKVLISGCRMKYPPLVCRETTGSTVENFETVEWCNEVVENGHWETDDSGPLNSTWVPNT